MGVKITKALTKKELRIILNNVDQATRNALLLEANTGLRISDIVQLKYSDIKKGQLEIIEKKTKKPQLTKINKKLVKYLENHKTTKGDFIFWNGKVKFASIIRKIQRRIVEACDYHNIDSSFISTHSFRKTFATKAYEETKDLLIVQKLLNHSSVDMTKKYIQINKEEVDSVRENTRIGF